MQAVRYNMLYVTGKISTWPERRSPAIYHVSDGQIQAIWARTDLETDFPKHSYGFTETLSIHYFYQQRTL